MEYFLPIAQVEINILFIFGLSLAVGILSGLFGVGGGFLMTPFLIFLGIPPAYAVPNEASNILGTSVSGSTTHYLKGTLDYKMGLMIVVGGTIGTLLGILTFSYFQDIDASYGGKVLANNKKKSIPLLLVTESLGDDNVQENEHEGISSNHLSVNFSD